MWPLLSSLSIHLLVIISHSYHLITCYPFLMSWVTNKDIINLIKSDKNAPPATSEPSCPTLLSSLYRSCIWLTLLPEDLSSPPGTDSSKSLTWKPQAPYQQSPHLTQTALRCNSNWPSCTECSSFMRLLWCILCVDYLGLLAWPLSRGLRNKLSWKKKPYWEKDQLRNEYG